MLTGKVYLPSFGMMADLGTRSLLTITVFDQMGVPTIQSLAASMMIFLVNQILTAVLGLLFLRNAKLVRANSEDADQVVADK